MHEQIIKIDNVNWRFQEMPLNYAAQIGDAQIEMSGALTRDMMEYHDLESYGKPHLPYQDPDEFAQLLILDEEDEPTGELSDHECTNPDLAIMLMNFVYYEKKGSTVRLPYVGQDVFWLFHDTRHALHDVYGSDLHVYSDTERTRVLEGAEMAKHYGFHIKPVTAAAISNSWDNRFHKIRGEANPTQMPSKEFLPLLEDDNARELFNMFVDMGITESNFGDAY